MIRSSISEILQVFFKLGLVAFGGPAAHIAMMQEEVVDRRQWMSREHFLDLVGATNLIPGPNSTEMAMHCGFHRAGWRGLIAAGVSFIFPAVVLTGCLAHIYVTFGTTPDLDPFLYGIRPAVLAIIIGAIVKLGQKAYKGPTIGMIGLSVLAVSFCGVSEVMAILGGGVLGMVWLRCTVKKKVLSLAFPLFLVFLKIGSILFGSGYVLIAYLEGEIVQRLQWLTEVQILDAVAMGQFTPGPVLSTATFVGYQIMGWRGAILATAGIFLPSFLFVAILNPLIPKMRSSVWLSAFLDAVNISALAVMVAVTVKMAHVTLFEGYAWLIALISTLVVVRFRQVHVIWVVLGGAVLGYFFQASV